MSETHDPPWILDDASPATRELRKVLGKIGPNFWFKSPGSTRLPIE